MKMKKRLFALALSVVTCLSLAACGPVVQGSRCQLQPR